MNGKAGNVNNAIAIIYRDRPADSLRDVLAIFDCDQVCAPDFFTQSLPLLNGAPDVAMVRPCCRLCACQPSVLLYVAKHGCS